jgi:hypothetical protein
VDAYAIFRIGKCPFYFIALQFKLARHHQIVLTGIASALSRIFFILEKLRNDALVEK